MFLGLERGCANAEEYGEILHVVQSGRILPSLFDFG